MPEVSYRYYQAELSCDNHVRANITINKKTRENGHYGRYDYDELLKYVDTTGYSRILEPKLQDRVPMNPTTQKLRIDTIQ